MSGLEYLMFVRGKANCAIGSFFCLEGEIKVRVLVLAGLQW